MLLMAVSTCSWYALYMLLYIKVPPIPLLFIESSIAFCEKPCVLRVSTACT